MDKIEENYKRDKDLINMKSDITSLKLIATGKLMKKWLKKDK